MGAAAPDALAPDVTQVGGRATVSDGIAGEGGPHSAVSNTTLPTPTLSLVDLGLLGRLRKEVPKIPNPYASCGMDLPDERTSRTLLAITFQLLGPY